MGRKERLPVAAGSGEDRQAGGRSEGRDQGVTQQHNGASARRQRRAVATRQALLRAGGAVFTTAGFQKASLGEIAETAGVTKGALYFHFAGKQHLADAVIAEMLDTWERLIVGVTEQGLDPLTALITGTEQARELLVGDPVVRGGTRLLNDPLVSSTWAERHYRFACDAVAAQLGTAATAGLLQPQVDTAVLARSVVTLIVGHHLICDSTNTLDQLGAHLDTMWQAMLPLIATDTWRQAQPRRPGPPTEHLGAHPGRRAQARRGLG